jgi:hypothetical protein
VNPVRVQLSRAKGWKMPPNTVSVARPSKWGNPFRVGKDCNVFQAVDHFRAHLLADELPITVEEVRRELRGKNLACWCKSSPCHADVLLSIANPKLCPTCGETCQPDDLKCDECGHDI